MSDNSSSRSDKAHSTRSRQWLRYFLVMVLLMMMVLLFGYYNVNQILPWSSQPWENKSSEITHGDIQEEEQIFLNSGHHRIGRFFVPYPHRYHFVVDESEKCQQQNPFLVLMVPVAPQNREARDAIRSTWGRESGAVSLYFLLGLPNEGQGAGPLQEQVLEESRQHRDVLQADFLDSYQNLTLKTMLLLEWFSSRCPAASYLMKIDSDMFLNVRKLLRILPRAPARDYMTGLVARGSRVVRDPYSKWYLPEEAFPEDRYPPYVMGLGYVMSSDLPGKILEASRHVWAVYIEDVYLGLCLRRLGIEPTDPPRAGLFEEGPPKARDSCYWAEVVATVLDSSERLLDMWAEYQTETSSGCSSGGHVGRIPD